MPDAERRANVALGDPAPSPPSLDGVAAAGEARAERAVVLLELGLPLLLRLHRSGLLLLHLAARAQRVDQPADPDALHRAGASVARDRAARSAQCPTAERAARASVALGRSRGGLGELHRVYPGLLHGPVVALLLVPRHLLVALAPGRIDVQILGGSAFHADQEHGASHHATGDLSHGIPHFRRAPR